MNFLIHLPTELFVSKSTTAPPTPFSPICYPSKTRILDEAMQLVRMRYMVYKRDVT